MANTKIDMFNLRQNLAANHEFNVRFSKVARSVVMIRVYHISEYSAASAERVALCEEREKNTKAWIMRECFRLNKEGQKRFIKSYIDINDITVVADFMSDLYDAAIQLVDILDL